MKTWGTGYHRCLLAMLLAGSTADASAPGLRAGFAAQEVTLPLMESWQDRNGNGLWDAGTDSYRDENGNGRFDTLWLAGYEPTRAARGKHDGIRAMAAAFDDGRQSLILASIDAVGFSRDDVLDVRDRVRRALGKEPGPGRILIAATHTHGAPDLLGLWGGEPGRSGVNDAYAREVIRRLTQVILQAWRQRQPARLAAGLVFPPGEADLQNDSRPPRIYDRGVRYLRVTGAGGKALGNLVFWSTHPETTGGANLLVTADFPHYLRDGVRRGIRYDGQVKLEGLGGLTLYFTGAIGGLLSTNHDTKVHDPWLKKDFIQPGFAKARAEGYRLAAAVIRHYRAGKATVFRDTTLSVRDVVFDLTVSNPAFVAGIRAGIIRRRFHRDPVVRTEISYTALGPLRLLGVPGEIYPELVNGGVENPAGADFAGAAAELPPLRQLMGGSFAAVIGLADDELGYILPRGQWDEKPPWTYGLTRAPYGEVNSPGPETGPVIHRQAAALIRRVEKSLKR